MTMMPINAANIRDVTNICVCVCVCVTLYLIKLEMQYVEKCYKRYNLAF